MKRRSEVGNSSANDADFNLNLFEHALKHAPSRNLILKLLTSQDKNVFQLFSNKGLKEVVKTPVKKLKKRDHCESPTALLRRRELEKIKRPVSAQSDCSEQSSASGRSSTLPFERILKNVTAYVEIKSGGNDRSGGAKALLKSMGATVCDKFSRNVTHVIFKDGSYQTYQRAKLLKVHFVSVLWLEAARRTGVKPPENNYPALGTKNYDQNVSLICSQMQKDYEEVIRDEIRRTLESGTPLPTTKSLIDNRRRTVASTSKRYETSFEFLNDQSSQDIEVGSILQKIRGLSKSQDPETSSLVLRSVSPIASVNNDISDLSKIIQNRLDKDSSDSFRSSMNLERIGSDILTSDSECGMVNGDFSRSKNMIDETGCATPLRLKEVGDSNMEITCSNDSENSESRSLLSNRYISRRKSGNEMASMELTNLPHEVTTNNETPKGILRHLKDNLFNSVSYLASKANVLSDRDSRKRKLEEKENRYTSTPDNDEVEEDQFYRLKTPKMTSKKGVKPIIISKQNVENLSVDNSKEEFLENQNVADNVMISSSRVSDSKKRKSDVDKRGSTEMLSLHLSSGSKENRSVEENKRDSTEMSSLHLSSGSKVNRSVEENKRGSTEMSSLHLSSGSKGKRSVEENKRDSTEMSSLHLSSGSKGKRSVEENKRGSTEMSSLHLSSGSKGKRSVEENKRGSTEMSSLHLSSGSKGKRSVEVNKSDSTEMSSLRVSTDSKKLSSGTSMSSLKLSKSSIEKSCSTNMSSLRISSENFNSKEMNDRQKSDFSPVSRRRHQEEKEVPVSLNRKSVEEEKLISTPFVTERKKRKNCRKSKVNESENDNSIKNSDCDFTKKDKGSLEETCENTRSTRRQSLALNKEIRIFEEGLKNRKDFHDKNKEIEIHLNKISRKSDTTKSSRKDLTGTPIKSGIPYSPFVNTRSRRRSARHVVEDEQIYSNEISRWSETTALRRKSVRLEGQCVENRSVEEVIDEEQMSDVNIAGKRQDIDNAKSLEEETTGDCENSDNTLARNKDLLLEIPSKHIANNISEVFCSGDTSTVKGKKAVVLLEKLIISPQKDKPFKASSNKKTSSETKLKTNEEHLVSISQKNTSCKNFDESNDEVAKARTQPERKKSFKISRSKSESDIKRRSRRIRKLYNPADAIMEEDIHKEILVNDAEERDKIRQEKVSRNNGLIQCSSVIGNVLLTQKAMDYLEKNKKNQKEIETLFKSPENVLDQLGLGKKKEKKNKEESKLNISSDEQLELAEEFVHKKLRVLSQPRKVSQKSRKSMRFLSQKTVNTPRSNRRSTLDFEPISLSVPKIKTKLKLDRKPTIVCTKMHRQDVQMFNQIVRKLGTFDTEDEVTSRTTHLVVGEVKRTINMLRALGRGCWILKQEWLLNSLEKGKWLPEEDYEATEFSPAVQKCRLEKSAFGPSYSMNIFLNCGPVYVAKSTTPRCSDLRELITLCKGKITKMPDNAVISVGAYFDGCKCVNEYWILDSIAAGKLKPLKKYLISQETAKSPFV